MNCFQLIKTVLDDAYQLIPGANAQKDAAIIKAMEDLLKDYEHLISKGCLDYSAPERRFAYLYRYTTSHANMVYELCSRKELKAALQNSSVKVASIGGGPGSDFLGLLKYCQEKNLEPQFRVTIFDRDTSWGESWSDVDEKLTGTVQMHTYFQPFDVTDQSTWLNYRKHFTSDIFTLIYFMSEVFAKKAKAQPYFDHLFSNIKPGAILLFVDNNDTRVYEWFDELCAKHGVTLVHKQEKQTVMPYDEQTSDLAPYSTTFKSPKLKGNVAVRIGVKQ